MVKFYIICMLIGLIVPFFSIVCNLFDGFLDFSIDLFDLDIGDISIDFLPLSINSICMFLLLFGGCGLLITGNGGSYVLASVIGIIVGYVGAVGVQTLIHYLRRNQSLADTNDMMLARKARVITSIEPDSFGTVVLSIEGSSDIQYTAKNIDSIRLDITDDIEIVSLDNNVAQIKKRTSLVEKYNDKENV